MSNAPTRRRQPIGSPRYSTPKAATSGTFDMLPPLLSDQTNSRVIDARHKFAKKKLF
jgi:hypothetical protein